MVGYGKYMCNILDIQFENYLFYFYDMDYYVVGFLVMCFVD